MYDTPFYNLIIKLLLINMPVIRNTQRESRIWKLLSPNDQCNADGNAEQYIVVYNTYYGPVNWSI